MKVIDLFLMVCACLGVCALLALAVHVLVSILAWLMRF